MKGMFIGRAEGASSLQPHGAGREKGCLGKALSVGCACAVDSIDLGQAEPFFIAHL